jgi:hypothetical protein
MTTESDLGSQTQLQFEASGTPVVVVPAALGAMLSLIQWALPWTQVADLKLI